MIPTCPRGWFQFLTRQAGGLRYARRDDTSEGIMRMRDSVALASATVLFATHLLAQQRPLETQDP